MHVNFFVILLNIVFFIGGLVIVSLILYLIVRAVVKDELKRLHIIENTKEPMAQERDKK